MLTLTAKYVSSSTIRFLILVVPFLLQSNSVSFAEPSLEETVNFIDAKFAICGDVSWTYSGPRSDEYKHIHEESSGTISTRFRQLDSDNIVSEEHGRRRTKSVNQTTDKVVRHFEHVVTYVIEVRLRDLSVEVTETDRGLIRVVCAKPECMRVTRAGTHTFLPESPYLKYYPPGQTIDMGKETTTSSNSYRPCHDSRQRIIKALRHAIRIAGGKAELF